MSVIHKKWINLAYGLLVLGLFFSARHSWHISSAIEEFAINCDEFGYLSMGKVFRKDHLKFKDFIFQGPQVSEFVSFLQSTGEPVSHWYQAAGPHAYYYQSKTNQVIPQYPPGVGAIFSLFPEKSAVTGLNQWTLSLLMLGALVGIGLAYRRSSFLAAGLFAFAAHEAFVLLERIQTRSFSINALVLPSVFCVLSVLGSRLAGEKRHFKLAHTSSFLGGGFLGLMLLIRFPVMLHIPGVIILHGSKRIVSFLLGLFLFGFLPLGVYQYQLTGNPFQSTYLGVGWTFPTLQTLAFNLNYYLGTGSGAKHHWALVAVVLVFAGCWKRWGTLLKSKELPFSLRTLLLASLGTFGIPLVFFLTYSIVTPYYLYPGILLTVWSVLCGVGFLELTRKREETLPRATAWAFLPALAVMIWGGVVASSQGQPVSFRPTEIPAELMDPRAWIWADRLSGSFWYYGQKPSFKIFFATSPELRKKIFQFAQKRGDRQYLVLNPEDSQSPKEEIAALGGRLILAGEVFRTPYFRIEWGESCRIGSF